jgi:transforming growth factor-beta-induced protein
MMANILNTICATRELSIFANAIQITSLDKILDESCDFTIFAPNNLAFAQLSRVNLNILTDDIWRLTEMLSMHIIPGKFDYRDLLKIYQSNQQNIVLTAIDSSRITINLADGIKVCGSTVVSTEASLSNGILHLIDRVIIPDEMGDGSLEMEDWKWELEVGAGSKE